MGTETAPGEEVTAETIGVALYSSREDPGDVWAPSDVTSAAITFLAWRGACEHDGFVFGDVTLSLVTRA